MTIKEYSEIRMDEILDLYNSVGWTAYTSDPATLETGLQHSLLTLGAYEGTDLVGLIRVVGDGQTIVYIQDILVKPEYQRRGIGTALMRRILQQFSHVRQIFLTTDDTPKTKAFYRALGFAPLEQIGCCGFVRLSQIP